MRVARHALAILRFSNRHPARPKPTLTSINAEAPDTPPEPPVDDVYSDGILPFIVMVIDEEVRTSRDPLMRCPAARRPLRCECGG